MHPENRTFVKFSGCISKFYFFITFYYLPHFRFLSMFKKIILQEVQSMEPEDTDEIASLQTAVSLPQVIYNNVQSPQDFYKMAFEFQQIMMLYDSATKQIVTKLEILNKEYKISGNRNPIETIKSRIKSADSIAAKLEKKGYPVTFEAMTKNLNDIAGVRVICPYITDIYTIRCILLKQPDIKLVQEHDYIKTPKNSGYRSLHIVVETPVYLSETQHIIRVEIQLRTIAMDFWASLEHELHYKTTTQIPDSIRKKLSQCAETIAATDRKMEEIALELQTIKN